jgi:hypothetical protein
MKQISNTIRVSKVRRRSPSQKSTKNQLSSNVQEHTNQQSVAEQVRE